MAGAVIVDNPYQRPRFPCDPGRDLKTLRYADGSIPHRGDEIIDSKGRRYHVAGLDGVHGRLTVLDRDCSMRRLDAGECRCVSGS